MGGFPHPFLTITLIIPSPLPGGVLSWSPLSHLQTLRKNAARARGEVRRNGMSRPRPAGFTIDLPHVRVIETGEASWHQPF